MSKDKNDMYTLVISDTGIGIAEEIDFRNTESLGLQLVNDLTMQLGGTIELDRSGGTTWTLRFGGNNK